MAFTVNDVEVVFEPEKEAYREAFGALLCSLDALQERLERSLKKNRKRGGNAYIRSYEASRAAETAMREQIDALLGAGAWASLFGDTRPAAASHGVPLWFNLTEGLYDAMDAQQRPKACDAVILKYRTKRIARSRG